MNRSNISKQLNYGDLSRFVGQPVGQQFAKKRYAEGDTVAEELTESVTYEDVNGKKRTYRYNPETHSKPQPSGRMRKLGIDYTQLAYNPGINIFDQAEVAAVDPVIAESRQQNTPVSVAKEPYWNEGDIESIGDNTGKAYEGMSAQAALAANKRSKSPALLGAAGALLHENILKPWQARAIRQQYEEEIGPDRIGDPSRGKSEGIKGPLTVENVMASDKFGLGFGAGEKGWKDASAQEAAEQVTKTGALLGSLEGLGLNIDAGIDPDLPDFQKYTGTVGGGQIKLDDKVNGMTVADLLTNQSSIYGNLGQLLPAELAKRQEALTKIAEENLKKGSKLTPEGQGRQDSSTLKGDHQSKDVEGRLFNNLEAVMGKDVGYDHWAGMTGAGPSGAGSSFPNYPNWSPSAGGPSGGLTLADYGFGEYDMTGSWPIDGGGAGSSFPDQIGDWSPQSPSGPSWSPQSPSSSPVWSSREDDVGGNIDVGEDVDDNIDDYGFTSMDIGYKSGGIAQLAPGGIAPSDKPLDPGSFVISADVVSGVGDGSTESGIERMSGLLGIPLDGSASGPNGSMLGRVTTADGGPVPGTGLSDSVSTVIQDTETVRLNVGNNPLKQMTPQGKTAARVARDELVVDTKTIANLPQMFMGAKGPDLRQGQQMLTNFMDNVRANKTNTGGKQPGPLVPEGQDVMKGLASLFQRA